ncbi:MAG: LacI family DNA-binding transcriptional regulator [Puniceicoccaceae bacterium]
MKHPKRSTLADIAARAGTSKAAVSAFLSGKHYTSDSRHVIGVGLETQQRILNAARELHYLSDDYNVQIKIYPETSDICLMISSAIVGGFANPYFSRILNGALQARNMHSGQVILASYDPSVDYLAEPQLMPRSVLNRRVSSILLLGVPNLSLLEQLSKLVPVVTYLSREVNYPNVNAIVSDYPQAGEIALNHLWDQGHQNIEVVCPTYLGPKSYQAVQFCRGFEKAVAARGGSLSLPPVTLLDVTQPSLSDHFLKRATASKRSALFCLDDFAAISLWQAADRLGINVPNDLSILGCNDDPRGMVMAKLSTIRLPADEIGEIAIKETERKLLQPTHQLPPCLKLPVKLIERSSVKSLAYTQPTSLPASNSGRSETKTKTLSS